MVIAGVIGQEEAIESVNWETLGLLIGMILVGILRGTGLFSYLAIRSAQLAGGRPGSILVYLGVVTAVLSAFLDSVTTVVLGFFLQDLIGLNLAVVALASAALAMLVCRSEVEESLGDVEWPTILFFVGLFVMVGALEPVGFIGVIADYLGSASDSLGVTAVTILWGARSPRRWWTTSRSRRP